MSEEIGHFDPGPFWFSVGDSGVLPDRSNEIHCDPGLGVARQADGTYRIFQEWIFVDDHMPKEGEYVLCKSGEDSPIGISRFIDGEWDTGKSGKRPVFSKTERFLTSANVVYWMPLPKPQIQQNT